MTPVVQSVRSSRKMYKIIAVSLFSLLLLALFTDLSINRNSHQVLSHSEIGQFQPSAPYYATVYYPWYQNPTIDNTWGGWNDPQSDGKTHAPVQNWASNYLPLPNTNLTSAAPGNFDPEEGLYSSQDKDIVLWQIKEMGDAHISVALSSWWGQGHKTDIAFDKIIHSIMPSDENPYPNLRWAVYYEKQGYSSLSKNDIESDITYIKNHYATSPYYLKIDSKPVIFVHDATHNGNNSVSDITLWKQIRSDTGVYINMKQDALSLGVSPSAMDSWFEYAPANREGQTGNFSYYVSPGFWKIGESVRLCRQINGAPSKNCGTDHSGTEVPSFSDAVAHMVAAPTTWKIIETWNEWGEGTAVEPGAPVIQTENGTATEDTSSQAVTFGNAYITVLHNTLPPLQAGLGATTSISSSPSQPPVTQSPAPAAPAPIKLPKNTSGDPVIVAAGDISCGTGSVGAPCKQADTANLILNIIKTSPVKGVLVLGDSQYETGALSEYQKYYNPTWGQFYNLTYPVIGNHEYTTKGGSGYFSYFAQRTIVPSGKGYYSFNVGNWSIYALNSNCSHVGGCQLGSPQETWFRQVLKANSSNGSCQIMFMHYPYLSSDKRNFNYYNDLDQIWSDFYAAGGDIDLVGHSHDYERFSPLKVIGVNGNPALASDPSRGITEFVVGTGGRNSYGFGTPAPNSVVRLGGVFGVIKLTLHKTSADWQFIAASPRKTTADSTGGARTVSPGQVLDSGTVYCH